MAHQVDVHDIKRKLAGTGPDASVNCGVVSDGHSAYLRIDKTRTPKRLEADLRQDLESEGFKAVHTYFGTAYADAFPGVLLMTLNRPAPVGLARLLTVALRGSGYRKVQIDGTNDSDMG